MKCFAQCSDSGNGGIGSGCRRPDVLAQHQAVTYLQGVLHALGVGGLRGKSKRAHSAVGRDRAEEVVTERQGIRFPELQVKPRANVDARARD